MGEQEEDDDIWQPDNPTDFKVYNVPTELKNEYISMAKLMYDDDVWKVMADAMAALKEDKFSRVDVLEQRIAQLEEELGAVKAMMSKKTGEDDDDLKPTFGGGN